MVGINGKRRCPRPRDGERTCGTGIYNSGQSGREGDSIGGGAGCEIKINDVIGSRGVGIDDRLPKRTRPCIGVIRDRIGRKHGVVAGHGGGVERERRVDLAGDDFEVPVAAVGRVAGVVFGRSDVRARGGGQGVKQSLPGNPGADFAPVEENITVFSQRAAELLERDCKGLKISGGVVLTVEDDRARLSVGDDMDRPQTLEAGRLLRHEVPGIHASRDAHDRAAFGCREPERTGIGYPCVDEKQFAARRRQTLGQGERRQAAFDRPISLRRARARRGLRQQGIRPQAVERRGQRQADA